MDDEYFVNLILRECLASNEPGIYFWYFQRAMKQIDDEIESNPDFWETVDLKKER